MLDEFRRHQVFLDGGPHPPRFASRPLPVGGRQGEAQSLPRQSSRQYSPTPANPPNTGKVRCGLMNCRKLGARAGWGRFRGRVRPCRIAHRASSLGGQRLGTCLPSAPPAASSRPMACARRGAVPTPHATAERRSPKCKGQGSPSVRSPQYIYCAALTFLISAMSDGSVDSHVATKP